MSTKTTDSCAWMLDARADILTDRGVDSDDPRLMRMASAEIAALAQENARLREALTAIAEGTLGAPDSALESRATLTAWMWSASQARARTALRRAGGET